MVSFHEDQAEGLRRMIGGQKPRIFTFLSTLEGDEKALMLGNLCSSLAAAGSEVLLVDACQPKKSGPLPAAGRPCTLLDAAAGEGGMDDAIKPTLQGFAMAVLPGLKGTDAGAPSSVGLNHLFREIAGRFGTIIVDSEVDADNAFALGALGDGEIVVQVTPDPASIKSAYAMIKHLNARLGRRPFGIVMTGATEPQAEKVFANMAATAGRYLAVQLQWVGSVPADEHVRRAAGLGRPVTDAFPLAGASVAFRRLAQRFALSDTWREASQQY